MVGLPDGEKTLMICLAISTENRRVTDGQTSCYSIVRAMHTRCAVKTVNRDHASKFVKWKYSAMGRGARFVVPVLHRRHYVSALSVPSRGRIFLSLRKNDARISMKLREVINTSNSLNCYTLGEIGIGTIREHHTRENSNRC